MQLCKPDPDTVGGGGGFSVEGARSDFPGDHTPLSRRPGGRGAGLLQSARYRFSIPHPYDPFFNGRRRIGNV